jgi:drug/metabolite transporter (DMT)-like permease
LIDRGASPVELTEARAFIAMAGVGLIIAVRGRASEARSSPAAIPWLIVGFGLAVAAANVTYYIAISMLPVAVAIVIQYSAPALVVIWKVIESRRPPGARVTSALLLAMFGVVLLSEIYRVVANQPTTIDPIGALVAFGSAIAFATYVVLGESVGKKLGPDRAVFWGFVVASVFWLLFQLTQGRPDTLLDTSFTLGIFFLGIVGTIAPFLLFVWGLRIVSASAAGVVSTLEPVAAAGLAFWWLGQTLTPLQSFGAASVIVGIAIVQTHRPPSPEVLLESTAVE